MNGKLDLPHYYVNKIDEDLGSMYFKYILPRYINKQWKYVT